jgi:hypothetical protein
MNKVILLFICGLLICSCNTNPPTSPEGISYPAGKIIASTTINLEPTNTPAAKVVLLEDFANVSCVPCVISNQIIESLLNNAYANKIVVVKFPTNFPSPNDPFYLANSSICDARMSYYNIIFAPTLMVDGTFRPSATDSVKVKEKIDERLMVTAPFSIDVEKSFQDSSLIVNINVNAVNLSGINLNDLVLNTIITENDIEFDEAPGSNGEKVFYNVLRKIIPTDNGLSFTALSDTTLEWQTDLLSNWNPDNLHVVTFIQNVQTKEVLQAGADY